MDFKQLETFITIVKCKSFTKASEILYVTQPSVTNHIQALENELGAVLFVRTRRSVNLTNAGKILYKHAINIMDTYDEIVSDLDTYSKIVKGTLNLSVSSVPRKILLPEIIEKFSKRFPEIAFNVNNEDSRAVIDSILIGDTDFGIVGMKVGNPKLIYNQIMDDHIVYITPKNKYEKLKDYSNIDVEDLRNDNIILREIGSGTRQILEDELTKLECGDIIDKQTTIIHDSNTILDLVSKGVGTSFISQRILSNSDYKDKVRVLRVRNLVLNRKFYLVYNKNLQFSAVNKAFKDFITDEINELKTRLDIRNI